VIDYHQRKDLLRDWLKTRNYHVNDVRAALKWWEKEKANGNDPTDGEVLAQAEAGHRQAVEAGTAPPPYPVEKEACVDVAALKREIYREALIISLAASGASVLIWEAIRWTASRLLQAG